VNIPSACRYPLYLPATLFAPLLATVPTTILLFAVWRDSIASQVITLAMTACHFKPRAKAQLAAFDRLCSVSTILLLTDAIVIRAATVL